MQETQSLGTLSNLALALQNDFSIPSRLPGSVASVTVQPSAITVGYGASYPLTATTRDVYGTMLSGKVVTWASSDPTIATVSPSGVVTARSTAGVATITATSEGYAGSAAITAANSAFP
ncbi:MAG: Ig-like domain-containing protein [Gemmatimonadaceae bacterium]